MKTLHSASPQSIWRGTRMDICLPEPARSSNSALEIRPISLLSASREKAEVRRATNFRNRNCTTNERHYCPGLQPLRCLLASASADQRCSCGTQAAAASS